MDEIFCLGCDEDIGGNTKLIAPLTTDNQDVLLCYEQHHVAVSVRPFLIYYIRGKSCGN